MNEIDKLMGLKNEIYFNRTEDIIVQSHLNPEAQVFVPSVKVCIFIKQVKKKNNSKESIMGMWLLPLGSNHTPSVSPKKNIIYITTY